MKNMLFRPMPGTLMLGMEDVRNGGKKLFDKAAVFRYT